MGGAYVLDGGMCVELYVSCTGIRFVAGSLCFKAQML